MITNFHDLYQKYAQDIYCFSYWLCGDSQEAEDITSETFVRALTASNEIRSETVKGYLLTIARNLIYQQHRKTRRFTELKPKFPAEGDQPERAVETKLGLQEIMNFLKTLPELDRSALLMQTQEGLPYEEIARLLDISVAAARVKVFRARIKLNEFRLKVEDIKL